MANAVSAIGPTIPSFALMVAPFGFGVAPAVIVVVFFATLPILRNTMIGIRGVDQRLVEAGRGMGTTAGSVLWRVELPLAGCGLRPATAYTPDVGPGSIQPLPDLPARARLTVTGKNFTEQLILGKIGVIAAKAAGFQVDDLTNVPGSVPARQLMLTGDADMTWEYTGTAWLTYLGESEGIPDQQEQYEAVRDADAANGLAWLEPAPLNNTYALAVRSEAVEEYPGLADVYAQVSPTLTDDALREMNLRVDEGGELPADVAFEFMLQQGFVTEP